MSNEKVPVVTPVGELHFVQISGKGKENYNGDGFDYTATVHLTGDDAEALKSKIDEVLGTVPKGKTVKSTGYRELLKDEEGVYTPTSNTKDRDAKAEKTGITAFTFKTGATFPDGRQAKIAVYNSGSATEKPKKIEMGDRLIGNGSKGAISGKMQFNERGKEVMVSLFLSAVQLTEFVAYTGDAGFEGQEGSFQGNDDHDADFPKDAAKAPASAEQAVKAKPRL